ncbi:DMT family transporter [Clostridium sp. AL.422]|uniref:DMT family transporter n=1 Tax=Clostridium TaxID=1485 RepID=UPI00293DBB51|nr:MULTISPECIES: DMT family transporter [unclassified Clostridium]MDV4150042.1 DMT family transporter [Clostridium sp. AL.422]
MYNFLSLFTGILITIMISLNGILSTHLGNYSSTFIIHIIGFLIISLILLFKKYKIKLSKDIPLILYSAGIIGVFTVLFNNLSFSILGASLTISIGLLGQTVTSIIIDNFGLMKMRKVYFQKKKIFGLLLIVLGIAVMAIY